MEAHLALTQPTQLNKVTTSCEIYSGPHDTQYCMEDLEQAFVEYASSCTDEAGGAIPSDMVKNPKLSTSLVLFARSYPTMDSQCSTYVHGSINAITIHSKKQGDSYDEKAKENDEDEKDSSENIYGDDGEVMFIELNRKNDDSSEGEPEKEGSITTEGVGAKYFDTFPARSELAYHKYLMCSPIPSIFLRNAIITEGCPSNLKIPCNIGKLDPGENSNRGVSNFTGRIKGMHDFLGNFTYIVDFMIVEDISSIINLRLSQVVLGKPFVEISNMTHDPPEGVVRFTNKTDEVAYKMPHMIEQCNSLLDLEKEHTKSVYLMNKEDKRRGVEYVMNKILGFYKECLELGLEYKTGMDDE
uniref:Retrotransposon Orf1 n=1 Tax=Tanacetum cinerariifolium TaxID=118510 RepID=A0A699H6Q3_TANCI|nr:retrotransposon Orf1 [Tanacetum cinerariifolium]